MISKYSVIQFAPNALSGEKINIGVVTYTDDETRVRFLRNWKRVKSFAGTDIESLKDFTSEVEFLISRQLPLPSSFGPQPLIPSLIEEIADTWANSITFTPPRASTRPVDALLKSIAKEFLTEPTTRERSYRDRRAAGSLARTYLHDALVEREGKAMADKYLHWQREVVGRYGPHVFDAVVANGKPSIVAQGISFELPQAIQLDQSIDALAFQVYDIRAAQPDLHIGILTLPPKKHSAAHAKKAFDRARRTYEGLKAEVVLERDAEAWAKAQIRKIEL